MPPIFFLEDELIFPHPVLHEPEGLLAVGGSLSTERLLLAYRWGIFPWYNDDQPILWWFTSPRLMLKPGRIHVSSSLAKTIRQKKFTVTFDQQFEDVIWHCSSIRRKGQHGTWILPEIAEAYTGLFKSGYAHSVEVYSEGELAGGMYGVALGKIFFGESMFSKKSNASKVALVHLCQHLHERGFEWIDCQQETPHLRSLGAEMMEENEFLAVLRENQLYLLRNGTHF